MPAPATVWFYVVTEEAKPILDKIFQTGVAPGSVTVIPEEDLEILREGVLYFPAPVVDNRQIAVPRLVVPTAS